MCVSLIAQKSIICHIGVLNVCFKCWLFLCFINQNRISKNNEGNQNKYFCISSEWSLSVHVSCNMQVSLWWHKRRAGVALGAGPVEKKIMVWIIWVFLKMHILCQKMTFLETLAVVGGSVVDLILCMLVIVLYGTDWFGSGLRAATFFFFPLSLFYTVILKIFFSKGVR